MESSLQGARPGVSFRVKKGHKDQVISSSVKRDLGGQRSPFIFLTNSEDGEIRMWDARVDKAVKLFKLPASPNEGNILISIG